MRVRALDKSGDWTFGNSNNNYKIGLDALKQNVITRVKSIKNDWFLDSEANIDWWNILGKTNNEETIKSQVHKTVIETYGVTSIKNIEVKTNSITRSATIKIVLKTIYDKDNINIEVGL